MKMNAMPVMICVVMMMAAGCANLDEGETQLDDGAVRASSGCDPLVEPCDGFDDEAFLDDEPACDPLVDVCLVVGSHLRGTKWNNESFHRDLCFWDYPGSSDEDPDGAYSCKLSKRAMISFDRATELEAYNVVEPNTWVTETTWGTTTYYPVLETDEREYNLWLADQDIAQQTMFLRKVSSSELVFDVVLGLTEPTEDGSVFRPNPFLDDDFTVHGRDYDNDREGFVYLSALGGVATIESGTATTATTSTVVSGGSRFFLGPLIAIGVTAIALLDEPENIKVGEDDINIWPLVPQDKRRDMECRCRFRGDASLGCQGIISIRVPKGTSRRMCAQRVNDIAAPECKRPPNNYGHCELIDR